MLCQRADREAKIVVSGLWYTKKMSRRNAAIRVDRNVGIRHTNLFLMGSNCVGIGSRPLIIDSFENMVYGIPVDLVNNLMQADPILAPDKNGGPQ